MTHWLEELDKASKEEREWRDRADEVINRYVDERKNRDAKTRFNILWANTETIRPALISATPRPEVRPRYKKKDPIARVAAKIAERALEFQVDLFNFVAYGKRVVNDYLLPGRGVTRLRYIPTIEKREQKIPLKMKEEAGETLFVKDNGERVDDFDIDDNGDFFTMGQVEEVVYEEVRPERVPWKWFRMEPADRWDDVTWVAFGAPYSKSEGLDRFGKKFLSAFDNRSREQQDSTVEKDKTIVWEIWDEKTRKQYFVAEGLEKPLEENDDPLKLEGFFPMPEPIYIVEDNDTTVPTPEFCLWQDQADELDRLSERIAKITEAIKARGAYAGQHHNDLSNILNQDDNTLVPIEDWMAFIDKGGLDGIVSWVPVDVFAKVLQLLEQQRAIKIQEIYELTGVSDILRGATDPRETAKAQSLKANFGNRRLDTKKAVVQDHFKQVYRLMVEIIVENFDASTLRMMVGLENENEVFDQALQLLQSDAMRAFSIDIETDSTIALDEQREKEGLAEAMQATASFVGAMFPLVQAGAVPPQVAFEILRDYFRKFRFGRKLDDLLDDFQQMQPQNQEAQQQQQEQQAELQKMQAEMQMQQQKMQMELQQMQAEMQLDAQKARQELQQDEEKHRQELRQDEEEHAVKIRTQRELGEVKADVQRQQAQARESRSIQ